MSFSQISEHQKAMTLKSSKLRNTNGNRFMSQNSKNNPKKLIPFERDVFFIRITE